jgi:flavodoxin
MKIMKSLILYVSSSGNTKKLAEAIQARVQCEIYDLNALSDAEKTSFWADHPADVIYIGTGVYSAHVGVELRKFLIEHPPPAAGIVGLFGTWLGWANSGPETMDRLKQFLFKKGVPVFEEIFLAFGSLGVFKMDHPNAYEIKLAGDWAEKIQPKTG